VFMRFKAMRSIMRFPSDAVVSFLRDFKIPRSSKGKQSTLHTDTERAAHTHSDHSDDG